MILSFNLVNNGMSFLMIPNLSFRIFSFVLPSKFWWSSPRPVIAVAIELKIFVESYSPPTKASQTTKSTFLSRKDFTAMSVKYSEKDIPGNFSKKYFMWLFKSSSDIFSLLIFILSFNLNKCGEVNKPTLYPASFNPFAIIAEVEPLPAVPVTCMTFNLFWGLPIFE